MELLLQNAERNCLASQNEERKKRQIEKDRSAFFRRRRDPERN